MSLVDAYVNAAMILSGMGPLGQLHTGGPQASTTFLVVKTASIIGWYSSAFSPKDTFPANWPGEHSAPGPWPGFRKRSEIGIHRSSNLSEI
jgi:hypothetical protein